MMENHSQNDVLKNRNLEKAVQHYLDSYTKIYPAFTEDELNFIESNISIIEYKKKDAYIHLNDIQKSIGFIHKGLIRSFFVDNNGKEITNAFFDEGEFATDYLAFIQQTKTKYGFQCIEDCTVISIPFETADHAFNSSISFANFGRKIAEWALEVRTKKYESFLFENAEDRFLSFAEQNKNILYRISLTHLSSYLGVERQTLSRIRSQVLSK